jgi:hypothetical protein
MKIGNWIAVLLEIGGCCQLIAAQDSPSGKTPLAKVPEARAAQAQSQTNDEAPTFKVNVKLVNVFATVVDEHGAPVGGLKKDDFTVLEDGHPQKVAVFSRESGLPLSIVLAVDARFEVGVGIGSPLRSRYPAAGRLALPISVQ